MIPVLFAGTETNFNHNGLGLMTDTIMYEVTEERNGLFDLELEYPAAGRLAELLVDSVLILAKPNDIDAPHLFRVYEVVKTLDDETIRVYATSKTNDLAGNLVQEVAVVDSSATDALNAIKGGLLEPTPFNFISDIAVLRTCAWFHRNPLNCILGTEESIVSLWGGEVKRTNDTIYIYGRRGTDKVATVRQGKNLDGFKMTTSTKGLITSILPFFTYVPSDSDIPITIRGTVVNSPLMTNYPVRYLIPMDYSSERSLVPDGEMTVEDRNAAILTNLNLLASTYFSEQNVGCDIPKVTVEADLIQLSDSSDYAKFKNLEHIGITDTIVVWVEKFKVDVELTINKVVYNGLSETVVSFEAGNAKQSFFRDMEKNYSNNLEKLREYVNTVENGIYNSIRISADAKNNIFSGYTTPDPSLVKVNDLWYKPVADGVIDMYRWDGASWILAVGNADNLAIGSIDASVINLVNLNASNISTGSIQGANGAWNLDTGEFYLGSTYADAALRWNGVSLTLKMTSGETYEEYVSNTLVSADMEYYLSSSPTTLSGGSWVSTAPAWQDGMYLWSRTKLTYKDNNVTYRPSANGVCIAGATGQTGDQGPQGIQGIQGPKGDQGVPGPAGEDGISTYFHIKYSAVANPTDAQITETPSAYIGTYVDNIAADSTLASKYTWSQFVGSQGPQGNQGIPGTNGTNGQTSYLHIAYATNSTGTAGFDTSTGLGKTYIGQYTDFTLEDSTDPTKYTWSLIQGPQGPQGPQGIQGLQGPKGDQGIQGPVGADGVSSYTHIAYATNSTGTSGFSTSDSTGKTYIGMYVDSLPDDSTTPSMYNWTLIKGADGAQGIQGPTGANGQTSYLHIAYATNSTGTTGFSTTDPVGKTYIGQYTDFTAADSTTPSMYSWSLFQGPQGLQGPKGDQGIQGLQGPKGDQGIQGPVGADGLSSYAHIAYATNSTGTAGFSTTDPIGKTYIGMYVDNLPDDSTTPSMYKWSLIKGADGAQGIQGPAGANGQTSYLHIAYATNATGTTGFDTTVSTGKTYIGQYTDFTAADSTDPTKYSWSLIQGPQGLQGPQGATGSQGPQGPTGVGVSSVVEYYLATTASSGVTSATPGWTTAIQTMTVTNKYLWNYEVIHFTDGSSAPTVPVIIGVYGNTGNTGSTGATGRSLNAVTEYYLASAASSGVTRATAGWTTTPQVTSLALPYLWNYEKLDWSSGTTPTYVEPIIIAIHGATGPTGATGTGVESITEEYYLSTSNSTQTGGTWSTSKPTWVSGKYIWTRTKIVYKNPASTVYTPALVSEIENKVYTLEQVTTDEAITNTFIETFGSDDTKVITKGITTINKDGVSVAASGTDINSKMKNTGFEVLDGSNVVAVFGESGAVIPKISANVLNTVTKTGFYDVGAAYAYKTLTQCLNDLFTGTNKIHMGEDIWVNVNSDVVEDINIIGLQGYGRLIINLVGVLVDGRWNIRGNQLPIYIISTSTKGRVKRPADGIHYVFAVYANSYVQIKNINIDGYYGDYAIDLTHGGNVHLEQIDIINSGRMVKANNASSAHIINCQGSLSSAVAEVSEGAKVFMKGNVPSGGSVVINNGGFYFPDGTITRVASSFSPGTTSKQLVQIFNPLEIFTYHYNTTTKSDYYGATAAQNRWTTATGFYEGVFKFGAEIYNLLNGGTGKSVRMRLRRKNSTHGTSAAVMPRPYKANGNAWAPSFANGAVRGGWSGWATVDPAIFLNGENLLKFYNGATGNDYAIWDACEVEVTVTKTV